MSRGNDPENLNNPRNIKNSGVPIPPLRLRQAPIKVKLFVSEQLPLPPSPPPIPHPVQVLISEQPPRSAHRSAKRPAKRKVQVLITPKSIWKSPPPSPMTEARSQKTGSWKVKLLVTTLLLISLVGVLGGGIVAALFIFNPAALGWLPGNRVGAGHTAQTLKEIEAEAYKAGVFAGSPLYVSTYPGFASGALGQDDFLLPIYASSILEKLTELRVYRQTKVGEKTVFELKDRIAIEGPTESDAIAPLTASARLIQGSDRLLALKELEFVEGKAPAPGIWIQLSGEWEKSGTQVAYGRMLHYDPLRARFHTLLTWTSPAAELPQWQQVTGDEQAELLVNQTVGLEPHFQVYQLKKQRSQSDPLELAATPYGYLTEITLTQSTLQNRTYKEGLLLAQNGLWAAAQELLEAVKQNGDWSPNAQAQLDLVKLHAQATKAQADRTWASPTQQILALLTDGRWSKALSQLKTAHQNGYDITNFLTTNADHLLPRVEASLVVHPGEADVLRWGTLLKACCSADTARVASNNRDAVTWLQNHQAPTEIQQILALLSVPLGDISITNPSDPPEPQSPVQVKEKAPAPVASDPEPLDPIPPQPADSSAEENQVPEPLPERSPEPLREPLVTPAAPPTPEPPSPPEPPEVAPVVPKQSGF